MLRILGQRNDRPFCDRLSRRSFLQIGGLALGGLTLPDLLRAEAASGSRGHKSVIMIFLPGGPPHQDMYDLKPDASGRGARRIQANQNQRAGHRDLRTHAAPGWHDGQARADSHDGRRHGRPLFVSVHDRPQPPPATARGLARVRLGRSPAAGSDLACDSALRGSFAADAAHAVQLGQARLPGPGLCTLSAQWRRQGRPRAARRHARATGRPARAGARLGQLQSPGRCQRNDGRARRLRTTSVRRTNVEQPGTRTGRRT